MKMLKASALAPELEGLERLSADELTRRLPVALLIPEEIYRAEQERLAGGNAR